MVVSIVDDPLFKKRSLFPRLCFTIICILRPATVADKCGHRLSAPTLRLWHRIFRHIAVALPGLPEDDSLTNDPGRLVEECFEWIDDLDVANNYRDPPSDRSIFYHKRYKDLAKEQEWRHQFKSEESPFSNHFVFFLSRLLPERDRTNLNSWRLRMLDDMSEEDRLVALKDDEHDDDPEETAGETIPAASSDTGDPEQEDGKRDDDDEQTGPRLGVLDEPVHGSEQENNKLPDVVIEDLGKIEARVDDEARESLAADSELDQAEPASVRSQPSVHGSKDQ